MKTTSMTPVNKKIPGTKKKRIKPCENFFCAKKSDDY